MYTKFLGCITRVIRVTAMIRRSGLIVNRKKVKRNMKDLHLIHSYRRRFGKDVSRTIVVSRPNIVWETDFTKHTYRARGRSISPLT